MSKNISLNYVISVQLYSMKHKDKNNGYVLRWIQSAVDLKRIIKLESGPNVTISFFFLPDFELGILLGNGRPARLGPSQSCQGITVLPCSLQGVRTGPQLPWSGVFDLAQHFWGQTKS